MRYILKAFNIIHFRKYGKKLEISGIVYRPVSFIRLKNIEYFSQIIMNCCGRSNHFKSLPFTEMKMANKC